MNVLGVAGATKAATTLYDSMGLAAIGLISLIVVVGLLVAASLIMLRAIAPIIRDLKAMTEANALLAERLENAIESCECHRPRKDEPPTPR